MLPTLEGSPLKSFFEELSHVSFCLGAARCEVVSGISLDGIVNKQGQT